MIASTVIRVTAQSALLTAIATAMAAAIGWMVFEYFGVITMVLLFVALNTLLVLGFAGMVVGSLALAKEPEHPVAMATACGALQCIVIMLIVPGGLLGDIIRPLAPIIIPVAAMRAWRGKPLQRTLT